MLEAKGSPRELVSEGGHYPEPCWACLSRSLPWKHLEVRAEGWDAPSRTEGGRRENDLPQSHDTSTVSTSTVMKPIVTHIPSLQTKCPQLRWDVSTWHCAIVESAFHLHRKHCLDSAWTASWTGRLYTPVQNLVPSFLGRRTK